MNCNSIQRQWIPFGWSCIVTNVYACGDLQWEVLKQKVFTAKKKRCDKYFWSVYKAWAMEKRLSKNKKLHKGIEGIRWRGVNHSDLLSNTENETDI